MQPLEFVAIIKKLVSKIDVVGDKVGQLTLDFYATSENLTGLALLQQPDSMVRVRIEIDENLGGTNEKVLQ